MQKKPLAFKALVPFLVPEPVPEWGFVMAAKRRHWKEKNGRFWARLSIPERLRPAFGGKSELLEPLGGDLRIADRIHPAAVARLQKLLEDAEQAMTLSSDPHCRDDVQLTPVIDLTEEIATSLIWDRFSTLLEDDTAKRTAMPSEDEIEAEREKVFSRIEAGELDASAPISEQINGYLDFNLAAGARHLYEGARKRRLASLRAAVADGATRPVDHIIQQAVTEKGIALKAGTRAWRDFGVKLMRAEIDALERTLERDSGRYSDIPQDPLVRRPEAKVPLAAPVSLRQLFRDYIAKKQKIGKHRDGGANWENVIEALVKFLGHDDARKITSRKLMDWRDALMDAGASPKTVSDKHLAAIRAILKWAHEEGRLPTNEAASVRQEVPRRVTTRERGYTEAEAINLLTASLRYQPAETSNPANRESAHITAAKRWVPLLCAFTGARVAEITQLRKEDLRQERDRWIMRITPDAGSVKTGQYRDVPLHRQIEELGFIAFVAASAPGPLFHNAKTPESYLKGARATAGRLSGWLNEMELVPKDVQPSHGWRHRFKTVGRELGISDRVIDAIQGHAGRVAADDYGDVTMVTRIRAIDQFPFYPVTATPTQPTP